ncbi:MAG: DUF4249 family protein [Prolixibacteraceae bacterium]
MQLRIRLYHSLLLLLTVLAISCHTLTSEQFPEFNPVPTVISFLAEGDTLKVHVSLAEKLDVNPLGVVEDATVDLYINDAFAETLKFVDNGIYTSTTIVRHETKYHCKVNVPGYEQAECTEIIPSEPTIKSIEHINIAGYDIDGRNYSAVKVEFENDLDINAYYQIIIHTKQNNGFEIPTLAEIVDPVLLNEGLPMILFSNELIEKKQYVITINYNNNFHIAYAGPVRMKIYPFYIELRRVSESYYRYKKQLYLYEKNLYSDNVLTGTINQNLYSNIDHGYGIFAGYSFSVSDVITPNLDGYYD